MSWQIINVEPAYGVCDQCKKHDCGIIDGQHKWIMTGIYDKAGDAIVIGYRCVEMWANNLGISREVVEQTVLLTPTDEQIGDYVRRGIDNMPISDGLPNTRDELKAWLTERNVQFVAQWGDEKLKEAVIAHVKGEKL